MLVFKQFFTFLKRAVPFLKKYKGKFQLKAFVFWDRSKNNRLNILLNRFAKTVNNFAN